MCKAETCVFCQVVRGEIDVVKVYEDDLLVCFMDIEPINEGHILIVPKRHVLDGDALTDDEAWGIMDMSRRLIRVLRERYKPHGYSMMQNGGVFNDIGHYHMHVFPRYKADGFGWTYGEIEKPRAVEVVGNEIRMLLE